MKYYLYIYICFNINDAMIYFPKMELDTLRNTREGTRVTVHQELALLFGRKIIT
jgi:hypothetical protein